MKQLIFTAATLLLLASCAKKQSDSIAPTMSINGKWTGVKFVTQYDSSNFTEFITLPVLYNYNFNNGVVTKTVIVSGVEKPFYTGTYTVTGNSLAITITNPNAGVDTYEVITLSDSKLVLHVAYPNGYITKSGFVGINAFMDEEYTR